MKLLIKLLIGAVPATASAYLLATSPDENQGWRIAAAIVAAAPGAYLTGSALADRFLHPSEGARSSVEVLLHGALLELADDELNGRHVFRDHVAVMSFHVWLLPIWYRRIYRLRRAICWLLTRTRVLSAVERIFYRPALGRFAVARIAPLPPSNIAFREGVGLIGICLQRNRVNRALIVDFDTEDMQRLASCTPEEWKNTSPEETHHLKHEDFNLLADKYGQAVAVVIHEPLNGEPVGCLSFELPPACEVRIQDHDGDLTPSGDIPLTQEGALLIRKIKATRDVVHGITSMNVLTR